MKWRLLVKRWKEGWEKPRYQEYVVEADADTSVLDALEKAWLGDNTLVFEHACHHGVCGACGMVINGVERLACITRLGDVAVGNTVVVEPLRGFPVISDLAVDKSRMFRASARVSPETLEPVEGEGGELPGRASLRPEKLLSCLECGICYSACPIARTMEDYMGPAALALASKTLSLTGDWSRVSDALGRGGVWSCHAALECSVRCPAGFDPGGLIMVLRGKALKRMLGGGR